MRQESQIEIYNSSTIPFRDSGFLFSNNMGIIKYLSVNLMYTYKLKINKVKGRLNESVRRNGITLRIKSTKRLSKDKLFEKADSYLNKNYGVRLVEALKTTFGKISGNRMVKPDIDTEDRLDVSRGTLVPAREVKKTRGGDYILNHRNIKDGGYTGENKKRRHSWVNKSNRYSEKYIFEYAIYKSRPGKRPIFIAGGESEDSIKKNPDIVSNVLRKYGLDQFTNEQSVSGDYFRGKDVKYFEGVYKCEDIKNPKAFDNKKSLRGIITTAKKKYDSYDTANYYIAYRAMPLDYYDRYSYYDVPLFDADEYIDYTDWNDAGTVGVRRDRDVYDDDYIVSSDYRYNADSDTWVGDDYPDY